MAETVSFASGKKSDKTLQIKKRGPLPANIKYAMSDELPASEAKDVLIYTLDTDELWHGNGPGYPMTKVNDGDKVTKDVTFVGFDIGKGAVEPEIPVPYFGTIKEVRVATPINKPLASRLIMDLECYRNNTWVTVKRIFVEAGKTRYSELLDFKINDEILRLNAIEVQTGGIDSIVTAIKIDV